MNIGEQGDRHLISGRARDQDAFQLVDVVTEIASVSDTDRVALPSFHGCSDRIPSYGGLNNLVYIFHSQSIPRRRLAVRRKIEEITSCRAFRECAPRVRKIRKRFLDFDSDVLNSLQVGAKDLDSENRAESS